MWCACINDINSITCDLWCANMCHDAPQRVTVNKGERNIETERVTGKVIIERLPPQLWCVLG